MMRGMGRPLLVSRCTRVASTSADPGATGAPCMGLSWFTHVCSTPSHVAAVPPMPCRTSCGPHRGRHEDRPGTRRRRTAIGAGEGDSSVRGNRPGRGGGHCVNISGTDRTRGRCQKSAADSHDASSNKTSSHLLISLIVRTFLQLNEMPRGWKRRPEQLWRAIRHLAVAIRDQGRHERPPGRSLPCPHRAARPCFTSPRGRGSGVRCVLSACRASRRCGLIQPRPWAAVQALLKHGLRAPEELARAGQGPRTSRLNREPVDLWLTFKLVDMQGWNVGRSAVTHRCATGTERWHADDFQRREPEGRAWEDPGGACRGGRGPAV